MASKPPFALVYISRVRPLPRQSLVLLLIAALVLWHSLGVMHRLAHAEPGHAHGSIAATLPDAGVHESGGHGLGRLFADHQQGSSDCRLLDQLAHADGAPAVAAAAASLDPPAFLARILSGQALARWAALFDARGPPAFR